MTLISHPLKSRGWYGYLTHPDNERRSSFIINYGVNNIRIAKLRLHVQKRPYTSQINTTQKAEVSLISHYSKPIIQITSLTTETPKKRKKDKRNRKSTKESDSFSHLFLSHQKKEVFDLHLLHTSSAILLIHLSQKLQVKKTVPNPPLYSHQTSKSNHPFPLPFFLKASSP